MIRCHGRASAPHALALVVFSLAACDSRSATPSAPDAAGDRAFARDAGDVRATDAGPAAPSASTRAADESSDGDAGPDEPFRSNNNHATLTGARIPGRAVDDAKLRREVKLTLATPSKTFVPGKAFLLRPGIGSDQIAKRIDGQSVVEASLVVKLRNAGTTPQCNIHVSAELRDAKGATVPGVILREQDVLGDVGGFRNDPTKLVAIGAHAGVNLSRNCLGAGDTGFALFSGNLPLASLEAAASAEMTVRTWSGEGPPLVGPRTKVMPVAYTYAPDPANNVTIDLRNTGARAAAVRTVRYVVLDEHDDPLLSGWTAPVGAGPGPRATVKVGPGETLKTDDTTSIRVAYQGHGGTKMIAWVDFVDAP